MPEITATNISKHYGSVRALHNVHMHIKNGEYVVLLGPSGCGKTTLLKIIAGTVEPSSGTIMIGKQDVTTTHPEDRHIGFVFQNYALFPHMSVLDNACYGLMARGEFRSKATRIATQMLALVHLENRLDAMPKELSGGMQQRLAVARALSTGAKLLLLDEPTSALDAHIRVELRNELKKMVKRLKLTAIHVTHDQEEAMAIADKVAIIRNGEIQQIGSPSEVYDHPSNPFVASFLGEANFIRVNFRKNSARLLGKTVHAKLKGEQVAMIRPEHLRFAHHGTKVSFVSRQRFGPYYKYTVDYNGMLLTVRTHTEWENPGWIEFSPHKVRFYQEPEEGLERSLKIQ